MQINLIVQWNTLKGKSFDFLGHKFKTKGAKNKYGKYFTSFLPAIAEKAKKAIRKEVRGRKLQLK